jgi:hypothetical protein
MDTLESDLHIIDQTQGNSDNSSENDSFVANIPSIDMEAVYFDEVSEIQSRLDRIQSEAMQREDEEKLRKSNRKLRFKVAVLMIACILIGGIIGVVISTSRLKPDEKLNGIPLQNVSNTSAPSFSATTSSPSLTPSQYPTLSINPSLAPSCVANYQWMASISTSTMKFQHFQISGSGYVSLGVFGSRYSNYTEFREFIYNHNYGSLSTRSTRLRILFDLTTLILSHDGDKMIVGAGGYNDRLTSFGGAVLIFRQQNGEWKEMYRTQAITPGGFAGRVIRLASDTNVTSIAVIAGIEDASQFPWFARVYSLPDKSEYFLTEKGKDFLTSRDSLVGLSANGRRFFLYEYENDDLKVLEFEPEISDWSVTLNIDMSGIPKIKQMLISMDGQNVLVISSIEFGPKSFIYRIEGIKWVRFPLEIDSREKMIFHIYGAISESGTTAAITISWLNLTNGSQQSGTLIFQRRALGYEQTSDLSFPKSVYVDGARINTQGNLLVVCGNESLKVFSSVC